MRGHFFFAVLQNFDVEVLRIGDLVFGDDPWAQGREGVEALADIAGVVLADAPGIALADIPANGVAEDDVVSIFLAHIFCARTDHGTQLALEIDVLGNFRQHDRTAGSDDGRCGFQEELGHQFVGCHVGTHVAADAADHFSLVCAVVGGRSP